ncbi:MAG: leucine-rich repeat protein [Candidatus Limisoma sp.]
MKKTTSILTAVALGFGCLSAAAETYNLEVAGGLASAVGDNKYNITQLTVTGPVSNSDIALIRDMAGRNDYNEATEGKLVELDLSGATIVANANDGYYFKTYPKSNTTTDNVVGTNMFRDLNLTSIALPAGVTSIEANAFMSSAITSIVIPDGVTTIGSEAFSGCGALAAVTIPKTVTSLGNSAFSGCMSLTAINLPAISTIADGLLNGCSALAELTIPVGVTSIGNNALQGCSSLTTLDIPATVATLGFWCVKGTNLSAIHCRGTVPPTTGYGVLEGIDTAECTLYVPESAIATYRADSYWGTIVNIVADESKPVDPVDPNPEPVDPKIMTVTVTEPGTLAAAVGEDNKYLVEDLTIVGPLNGADLDFIRQMAGRDFSWEPTAGALTRLDISQATLVYQGTYSSTGIRQPVESDYYAYNEWTMSSSEPIKMAARQDALPELVFTKTNLEEVVLPTSITKIYSSFSECYSLKGTVVIPEGVTTIGDYAFESTGIEHVVLPSTLAESTKTNPGANESAICAHAFDNCWALKSIEFPASVHLIRDAAFQNCVSLTEVTIPETITNIGQKSFGNCTGIKAIYAESATPASAYYLAFDGMDKLNCVVTVPVGSRSTYRNADEWCEFLNIIEQGETAQFAIVVNDASHVAVCQGSEGAEISLTDGSNTVLTADVVNPLTVVPATGYTATLTLDAAACDDYIVAVGAGSTLTIDVKKIEGGIADLGASSFVYDRAAATISAQAGIRIYDITGKVVASTSADTISVASLPAGVYIAKSNGKTYKFCR